MTSHLVIKRLVHDRDYMPGEFLVDLDEPTAQILADRGFIQEVGDDLVAKRTAAIADAKETTANRSSRK